MILTWMCNDTKATRTSIRVAAYLIIGSIVLSTLLAIIYLCCFVKTPYVIVGTGEKDDPDNYDKQPKAWFVLGYIFFGLVIVVFALFFVWTVEQYKEKKGDGADDDNEEEKAKMMDAPMKAD